MESTRSEIWGKPQKEQKRQKRQRRVRFASLFSFFFLLLKRLAGVYFVDVAIEQPQNPQQKTPRDQKMDKEVRDMGKHHLTNRSDQGMAYERTRDGRWEARDDAWRTRCACPHSLHSTPYTPSTRSVFVRRKLDCYHSLFFFFCCPLSSGKRRPGFPSLRFGGALRTSAVPGRKGGRSRWGKFQKRRGEKESRAGPELEATSTVCICGATVCTRIRPIFCSVCSRCDSLSLSVSHPQVVLLMFALFALYTPHV